MLRATQCPIESLITRDLWDKLLTVFDTLHKRFRFVLTEHYLKGRLRHDIARDMGLSRSRVDQLILQAECSLRSRMGLAREQTPGAEEEAAEIESPWLVRKQVCFRLGITDWEFRDWLRQGKFPQAGSTVGKRQYWHRDIVDNFVVKE